MKTCCMKGRNPSNHMLKLSSDNLFLKFPVVFCCLFVVDITLRHFQHICCVSLTLHLHKAKCNADTELQVSGFIKIWKKKSCSFIDFINISTCTDHSWKLRYFLWYSGKCRKSLPGVETTGQREEKVCARPN